MMYDIIKSGFTLIEIIVVLVIAGTIAAFAIPRYNLTMEQSRYGDARHKLQSIHAANSIRFARIGYYWPFSWTSQSITEINTDLSINIDPEGFTYTCQSTNPGNTYTCTAVRNGALGQYTLTVTEAALSSTNPSCSGQCPL